MQVRLRGITAWVTENKKFGKTHFTLERVCSDIAIAILKF